MTQNEPSQPFTAQAVKAYHEPAKADSEKRALNEDARAIAAQYRRDTMSPVMVSGVLRIAEFCVLAASGAVLALAYVGLPAALFWYYPVLILAASAATVVVLEVMDCYLVPRLIRPVSCLPALALSWAGTLSLMTLAGFFLKVAGDVSRVWLGGWFVIGFVLVFGLRLVLSRAIRRWARNGAMERRAVIVGGGKPAENLIRAVEQQAFNDIRICGVFDDRNDTRSPPIVAGYPKLGSIDELVEFARIARIDMLIVSLPLTAEARVLSLLKKLWVLPVDIRLSAHSNQLRFRPRSYSYIGAVPMLDIFDKPINDWDSVAKRTFDIVFSLVGIVLLSPVMLATALAIKLDSKGPVLFRQQRHGFNNEPISVFKFRSMYVDQCDPSARNAVTKNDPRVTRIGRFIRKTSIDELPQFFNVLKGDLSLVGPRPHAVAAQTRDLLYTEVVDGYFARHRVKPGVTGWAQINGWRGEMDTSEKIRMRTECDLHYIENWSLWFDMKILFLTPIRLLGSENAY